MSGQDFAEPILSELLNLVKSAPQFIEPFYYHFYLCDGDTTEIAYLKLQILGFLTVHYEKIFLELRLYLSRDSTEDIFVIISVYFMV